jgi:general secretion pathway protein E
LYASLSRINTNAVKIITIEDPVEYQLRGVSQLQVIPQIGFSFATALRHMLRHDPDVMMVGEVRDYETAEIAIRSALTGHLVFSTLHTNDAAGAVTRLLDMGIEPFLVSSSLECLIAQRLVRLICPKCKVPVQASSEQLNQIKEMEIH